MFDESELLALAVVFASGVDMGFSPYLWNCPEIGLQPLGYAFSPQLGYLIPYTVAPLGFRVKSTSIPITTSTLTIPASPSIRITDTEYLPAAGL